MTRFPESYVSSPILIRQRKLPESFAAAIGAGLAGKSAVVAVAAQDAAILRLGFGLTLRLFATHFLKCFAQRSGFFERHRLSPFNVVD
jgi:hypothetical protein